MSDPVGISLQFEVDQSDMDRAASDYSKDLADQFKDVKQSLQAMSAVLRDLSGPLRDLKDLTEAAAGNMKSMEEASKAIKDNLSTVHTQSGGGGGARGGGAGTSTGLGGALGMLGGVGLGVAGGIAALPAIGVGSAAMSYGASHALPEGYRSAEGLMNRFQNFVGTVASGLSGGGFQYAGTGGPGSRESQRSAQLQSIMSGGGMLAPMTAAQEGFSGAEILGAIDPRQAGIMQSGVRGMVRGMGSGPLGFATSLHGSTHGYATGYDAVASLFPGQRGAVGESMRALGGTIGATVAPGMAQNYVQEAMARYEGFLGTRSSMASVGQYGGSLREMRGLRPAQFGYSPGEQGAAFSGLFQGFGGGDLTRDTQRTAMAYSRAYGVDMGSIGSAVGGLVNTMGGGQAGSESVREAAMARIMADAVASGFGRRLPEFAAAVGQGMSVAMTGPARVGQGSVPGILSSMSRLTGQLTNRGMGLQQAQAYISPVAGIAQNTLRGMFEGGGDQYQNAMMWMNNRDRFNRDPTAMMEGLEEAAQNPTGRQAMQFMQGPLQQIMGGSANETVRRASIRRMMPGVDYTQAREISERATAALEGDGVITIDEMHEIMLGVQETEVDEGEEARTTMRDIQASGERIMHDQLTAMQDAAGFAEQQYGLSAAMAGDAAQFHQTQMSYMRLSTDMMAVSALGDSMRLTAQWTEGAANEASAAMRGPEGERAREIANTMMRLTLKILGSSGGQSLEARAQDQERLRVANMDEATLAEINGGRGTIASQEHASSTKGTPAEQALAAAAARARDAVLNRGMGGTGTAETTD